jgi:ribonuclease-3
MVKGLKILQKDIGYEFKRLEILMEALTHSSAAKEESLKSGEVVPFYERLEFLGDSVLNLSITAILIKNKKFEKYVEGDLSKIRAALIQENTLVQIANNLKLQKYIRIGKAHQETKKHGIVLNSILADVVESIIGAVFVDSGFKKASLAVEKIFTPILDQIDVDSLISKDYKSALQEYCQEMFKKAPTYILVKESGEAHSKHFEMAVEVNGEVVAKGKGSTKKIASREAAKKALGQLLNKF